MENSRGQSRNSNQQSPSKSGDQQQERLSNPDSLGGDQNISSGSENTSGGTTDLGRNRQDGNRGSGISTKKSISGSDFDGQVSPE